MTLHHNYSLMRRYGASGAAGAIGVRSSRGTIATRGLARAARTLSSPTKASGYLVTPLNETGIHAGAEANRSTIGMEVVGNFMKALPAGETLDNATWAFAAVLWKLGKDATALYRHRDWMATACPGDALARDFRWMRCMVDARIEAIARGDTP